MTMDAYKIGDREERVWGQYVVTSIGPMADGREFCEKTIVLYPNQMSSLQQHALRSEIWTVIEGRMSAIINGQLLVLEAGQSVDIPLGAIHCFANAEPDNLVVHERQEGTCREADNTRIRDASGRAVTAINHPDYAASVAHYDTLAQRLGLTAPARQAI